MKKQLFPSLLLSVLCSILLSAFYPFIIWIIAQTTSGKGEGAVIKTANTAYYSNVAQKFSEDRYFWSRPSAVDYNAAGSAGSNKGPTNQEYVATVQARIDSFIAHNPGIKKSDIPSELVTSSGSGLDPDLSIHGAMVQVSRVARLRNIPEDSVRKLVASQIQDPLFGFLGPQKVNVLKLNIGLDRIATQRN